jgi:hypothetical protein
MPSRSARFQANSQRVRDEARRVARNFESLSNEFENKMRGLFLAVCNSCMRRVERTNLRANICSLCRRSDFNLFSSENGMDIGPIPEELQNLSMVEAILIARVHPVVSVFRMRGQQRAYSGHVMNFVQRIEDIATRLPHNPRELDTIILLDRETPNGIVHFRVRSGRVRNALIWLKEHNLYYTDNIIDEGVLAGLPEDGDIARDLSVLPDDDNEGEDEEESRADIGRADVEMDNVIDRSCYPNIPAVDQNVSMRRRLDRDDAGQQQEAIRWPDIDPDRLNEFTTEGLVCQAFPALFPYGRGDLRAPRIRSIPNHKYFKYLMDYRDGRFARDMRFPYYAYNTLARWDAINSGNVYVRNNQMRDFDASRIREILDDDGSDLAASIMYYGASLRGTRAYWKQRSSELLQMVRQ